MALASAVFGLTFYGILIYWIRLFGTHAYIGLVIVQTLWTVASFQLGRLLRNRLPGSWAIFGLPVAYLLGEFARSFLPWGGFSWGVLGYTQHNNFTMLKLAPYAGVWGISLVVLLVNALLAEAILRYRDAPKLDLKLAAAAKFAAAALALVLFPALLPVDSPDGKEAKLAMVQGNVPENTVDPSSDDEEVLQNHVNLTRKLDTSDIDLVVWAEGTFDRDPFRDPAFKEALDKSIQEAGAPFLVGAILGTRAEGPRNASLMFNADGTLAGTYVKQRLVPFGEFVPLRRFLQPIVSSLDRIPVDLIAGEKSTVFSIPQGKFGSVICYESTYTDLVRSLVNEGARLLVVSSNFSSFGRSAAADQYIAFSQLRAAEHRMWLAHTSISGISAVVGPDGRVMEKTGLFTQDVLTPTVRFSTTTTPYARLGDWVPFGAMAVALFLLAAKPLSRLRSRTRGRQQGSDS